MAERHRLGTFSTNGRFTSSFDIAPTNGTGFFVPNTFKVTPPSQTDILSKTNRRYGGSKRVAEIHDNGQVAGEILIVGSSEANTLTLWDQFLAILEDSHTQYYYEWRPDTTAFSTYFEIRGAAWDPQYKWVEFAGANILHATFSLNVAPLALGDPLDIFDDFSVDTLTAGDYSYDTGSAVTVTGGQLVPGNTSEVRLIHNVRGYTYTDAQATVKVIPGASVAASHSEGIILRRVDASNFLYASVDDTNALRIFKRVATVDTQLATTAFTPVVSTAYWLRFRVEGNVLYAEAWNTEPTPSAAPAASTSYALSSAEALVFGATISGYAGLRLIPKATDYRYDDFRVEPYTYRARSAPDTIDLKSIPGTAPAKVDVSFGINNPGAVQAWALHSWAPKPTTHNVVWNGDFEDSVIGTSGWFTGAVAGVTGAGTSVSRITTAGRVKAGTAAMQIVTPATTDTGANFPIYRRFRKGVTYTVSAWLSATTDATAVRVKLGVSGDIATSSAAALTTIPTLFTTTWTPGADADVVYVVIGVNAATATTFAADVVQVYEGTTAPTVGKHAEGKGAYPPFGILQAESAIPSTLVGWAIANPGATALGGYDLTAGALTTASAEWMVDPTLLVSDDFSGDVTIEMYGRVAADNAALSTTMILSAVPENNTAQRVYSLEWGSSGRTITLPSGGGPTWRMTRLGALVMPVDATNPSRWRVKLAVTNGSAATASADYLVLVPAKQRSLGATNKVTDATYPSFFHGTTIEEYKTIRSDLSGRYGLPPTVLGRDTGLSGQLQEFPTGDVRTVVKLSSVVPDDPTSNTATESPLSVPTTMHYAVWPRFFLTRSS